MIKLRNITKEYHQTSALAGVSFDIQQGEFVAIMGPSGSGKSTLMHIMGFLDRPSSGVYEFENKNTENFSDDKLANIRNTKIGFVFQTFNLLARASVLDNVALPLAYSKNKQNPIKTIKSVGLENRTNHLPSQLSGGEQQRVAVARALINNPQIIFADEPTGNLDSKSGKNILQILQNLNQQNKTIILVTHDSEIAKYANRIIYLKDGRVERNEKR